MSDLISREYLLNCAEYDDNGRLVIPYKTVENAPTAFDKGKVINELNTERNPIYREDGSLMADNRSISINKAISIVKKGGIE